MCEPGSLVLADGTVVEFECDCDFCELERMQMIREESYFNWDGDDEPEDWGDGLESDYDDYREPNGDDLRSYYWD